MRYPADRPTVDETVAALRRTTQNRHGDGPGRMIAVLWRAGLRQPAVHPAGIAAVRLVLRDRRRRFRLGARPLIRQRGHVTVAPTADRAEIRARR
jgi:hypothetical protein